MNRNQIFTTLEFIDDHIRMCIGEYYHDKYFIQDTFFSYTPFLSNGRITNDEEVTKSIKLLVDLAKEKRQIEILDVILCLPSNEMIVNNISSTSPVYGKNSLISQDDIDSALKVASTARHDENQEIMEIIPIEFTLDGGQILDFIPIGYKSNTFKTLFNVLTLPKSLLESYHKVIYAANLTISQTFTDLNCLYAGAIIEDDLDVAILDLSKHNTSLIIYKKGHLFTRFNINLGIDYIIKEVSSTFSIDYNSALSLVLLNGNAKSNLSSPRSIFIDDKKAFISELQLSNVIEKKLDEMFSSLSLKMKEILKNNNLDVVIVGYGSTIKNIDSKFHQYAKVDISIYRSHTLGLNEPNNTMTLGLIKLNYKKLSQSIFNNLQINTKNDIINNKDTHKKDGSSKFTKFILDEDEFE